MTTKIWLLAMFVCHVKTALVRNRCPSPCVCDTTNNQQRVHCDLRDSSVLAPLNLIDSGTDILEITPLRSGGGNAYGPDLPDDFDAFHGLSKLVINGNGIRTIPSATAQQLSQLVSLDLSENDISDLGSLSLSTFHDLTVLTLAQNHIGTLSASSLQSLSNLQALNLADNSIMSIGPSAFRNQGILRVLDLRNNNLRQLPNDFFDGIRRVERLDLRGNQLILLPRGLLRLGSLRFLLLDNNKLSTVPREFVQAWQTDTLLSDITLYGNPLHCDDSVQPLVDWVTTDQGRSQVCIVVGRTGDKSKSGTCPVCDSPSNLQGRSIDSLSASDFGSSGADGSSFRRTANSRPVRPPRSDATDDTSLGGQDSDDGSSSSFTITDTQGSRVNSRRDTGRESAGSNSVGRPLPAATRCSAVTCYFFSSRGQLNWDDAQADCNGFGWKLVEIKSSSGQGQILSFLTDVIRSDPSRNSMTRGWWIGARFSARSKNFVLPSSGRILPYSNWGNSQPNGYAEAQDCVEMWDTGEWGDLQCRSSTNNKYICQYPASAL